METTKNDVVTFTANNNAHALEVEKMRLEFALKLEAMRHQHSMEFLQFVAPSFQAAFSLLERQVAAQEARAQAAAEAEASREAREAAREAKEAAREEAEEARRNERHQLEMERLKR